VFWCLLVLLRVGLRLLPRWKGSLVSELMTMFLSFMTAVTGWPWTLVGYLLNIWLSVVAVVALVRAHQPTLALAVVVLVGIGQMLLEKAQAGLPLSPKCRFFLEPTLWLLAVVVLVVLVKIMVFREATPFLPSAQLTVVVSVVAGILMPALEVLVVVVA
jgi:hypothetical protein